MKDDRDPNELGQRLLAIKKVNPSLKLSEIADGEGMSDGYLKPVVYGCGIKVNSGSNGRVLS